MALPRILLLMGALAALLSCDRAGPGETRSTDMAGEAELVPTLRVRVSGDTVSLELTVANAGAEAVTLTFGSSQRYDFAVTDGSGRELWRWSAAQLFAQQVGTEVVAGGSALEYREVWVTGERGRLRAEARLVSTDHPVELVTEFEVPAG